MEDSGRALRDTPPFAKCAKDGPPALVADGCLRGGGKRGWWSVGVA